MKRGDIVIVAVKGDYGKLRPAVVIQSDFFNETHASMTVAPVTSSIVDAPLFRLTVDPTPETGLRSVSQIMIDKITTIRRDRIDQPIGRIDEALVVRVNRALALWLGIAA